jgi:transcriptional regulator with XRE-family HTH domain
MGNIRIGNIITAKRKEKGITQEELAMHLGVSKPAVSKWESGQSYPDILLLPVMASYFDISVDELIGYEPQMEDEDIQKLYRRLADAFAKESFEKVYAECQEYIKKYFSCWKLQLKMGLLLVNHCINAGSPERIAEIMKEALSIFIRIEKSSDDVNLAKQSVQLQAVCHLGLQQPEAVIDLLDNYDELLLPPEILLVRAYWMKGDNKKAIELLQGSVFNNLILMLDAGAFFLLMYSDNPEQMEKYYQTFLELGKVFEAEQTHPYKMLQINLTAAMSYLTQGMTDKALDALERYLELLRRGKDTIRIKGNDFFNTLEHYLASKEIDPAMPRSGSALWKDLISAVIENPAFSALEKEGRYQQIKNKLEQLQER